MRAPSTRLKEAMAVHKVEVVLVDAAVAVDEAMLVKDEEMMQHKRNVSKGLASNAGRAMDMDIIQMNVRRRRTRMER